MRRYDNPCRCAIFAQLLHSLDISQGVHAGSAVFLRERDAQKAHFGHLLYIVHGKFLRLVNGGGQGLYVIYGKFMYHI